MWECHLLLRPQCTLHPSSPVSHHSLGPTQLQRPLTLVFGSFCAVESPLAWPQVSVSSLKSHFKQPQPGNPHLEGHPRTQGSLLVLCLLHKHLSQAAHAEASLIYTASSTTANLTWPMLFPKPSCSLAPTYSDTPICSTSEQKSSSSQNAISSSLPGELP